MKHSNNPFYQVIADYARQQMLANKKVFWKDVVAASPFATVPDLKIEWGYIREMLEQELGCKLVPVSARDTGEYDPELSPEKFLPGAYHPTIGWAMPAEYARVAMVWADRRSKVVIGAARSLDAMVTSYQKQGLPITYRPGTLPVLELPPAEAAE